MADHGFDAIVNSSKYQTLVRSRAATAWSLSTAMLAIYLGFILLIAYAPKFLGQPIGSGVTTIGIPIGLFVILSAFLLTGLYVRKANATFDRLTREIVEEARQ